MTTITHSNRAASAAGFLSQRGPGALTDVELLDLWNEGDVCAGDNLCRRYVKPLTAFFRRKGVAEPEELVQRVLLGVVRSRARYRGDASFHTFVRTIARNVLVDLRREQSAKARRWQDLEQDEVPDRATPCVSQQCEARIAFDDLARVWNDLPPQDVELLVEYAYEGTSGPRLASSLEISLPALRSRLRRARARLYELTEGRSHGLAGRHRHLSAVPTVRTRSLVAASSPVA